MSKWRHRFFGFSLAAGGKAADLKNRSTLPAFHLRSVPYVLSLIEDGMLQVTFETAKHQAHLAQLAERYQGRHPDLADLCLIRMSELFPHHTVITVDEEDFRIYRRNNRETIPVLCPPRRRRR